jgi:hypothetical protein
VKTAVAWYGIVRRPAVGRVAVAVASALFSFGAVILAVVLFGYWRRAPDAMAEHRLPPAASDCHR